MQVDARGILFVDDESVSRRWFERRFSDEFEVSVAGSFREALELLAERGSDFAVVCTDYRMPEGNGLRLLTHVQRSHRHLVRLLASAYADKHVAIAAVNEGRVLRILEKPLDDGLTRETLREALEVYRVAALQRAQNESRAVAVRETLGFLAHELTTPLTTIRGSLTAILDRRLPDAPGDVAQFQNAFGEILGSLERIGRSAQYCQSLVQSFLQSARDAFPDAAPQKFNAAGLLDALIAEYPFEASERAVVKVSVQRDFVLPGRRDLVYLVLCTLVKNALQALQGCTDPSLSIEVGSEVDAGGSEHGWLRVADNGPGIAPDILLQLTKTRVTTRSTVGGSGMGLMFCQRVMQDGRGSVEIESTQGQGTSVTLKFLSTLPMG
ncbi:hybrid sensor histidine kinase/response regulator [Ramlibacter rhizophilus]|uniref:histidine kinase n=1 Tax=Ramlibacter rhizophilus TaxID=1781167 RepID=A0A4Z0BIR2_9BURK|nr:hybrid sensor histidine kinase/response regulator [Ramlibacter rhizophilus]TFY97798.1 response regulator [Ramlibacter rhizophilus]